MAGFNPNQPRDAAGRWTSENVAYSEEQGYIITKKNAAGQDVGIPRVAHTKSDAERIRKEYERQRKSWDDPIVLAAKKAAGVFDFDDPDTLDTIDVWADEYNEDTGKREYWLDMTVGKNKLEKFLKLLKEYNINHSKPILIDEDTLDGMIGDGKNVYYLEILSDEDGVEADAMNLDQIFDELGRK